MNLDGERGVEDGEGWRRERKGMGRALIKTRNVYIHHG